MRQHDAGQLRRLDAGGAQLLGDRRLLGVFRSRPHQPGNGLEVRVDVAAEAGVEQQRAFRVLHENPAHAEHAAFAQRTAAVGERGLRKHLAGKDR